MYFGGGKVLDRTLFRKFRRPDTEGMIIPSAAIVLQALPIFLSAISPLAPPH
jgi:hypothetical protein